MSRYIDADKIIYTWLIDNDGKEHDGVTLQSVIDMIPTADVVEVVRCKDCIHNHITSWNQGKRDKPWCHFTDLVRSNEFYCGFGEREEE